MRGPFTPAQSFAIEGKLLAAAAATQTTNSTRRKLFIETSGCLCHGHNEAVRWRGGGSVFDSQGV